MKPKLKRLLTSVVTPVVLMGCFISTVATTHSYCIGLAELNSDKIGMEQVIEENFSSRATGSINFSIKPDSMVAAKDTKLPLEAGETVTINASYSPASASMDFGLIAPDGYFYYVNVDSGSINKTIRVDERGNYLLAVRNNSNRTVSVVGYVNY